MTDQCWEKLHLTHRNKVLKLRASCCPILVRTSGATSWLVQLSAHSNPLPFWPHQTLRVQVYPFSRNPPSLESSCSWLAQSYPVCCMFRCRLPHSPRVSAFVRLPLGTCWLSSCTKAAGMPLFQLSPLICWSTNNLEEPATVPSSPANLFLIITIMT